MVIVILGFSILYTGSLTKTYYEVPFVSEVEPEILPRTLFYTGLGMILLAYLGHFASKTENEKLLQFYVLFSIVMVAIFVIFTMMLNYSAHIL